MKTESGSAVQKPSAKRRKLNKNQPRGLVVSSPITTSFDAKAVVSNANRGGGATVCATCHRALQTTTAGGVIQCGICQLVTCAVCSRTCTESVASHPPTPHLTWSPSPSPVPSPKRSVLSLTSSNVNLPLADQQNTAGQHVVGGRGTRRKHTSDDDDHDLKSTSAGEDSQSEYGAGCGRLICRNCCYEDAYNNTTTCLQCYGIRH